VAGFEKATAGDVICNGVKALKPDMKRAYIFQDMNQLFPWKTVKENIMYPLVLSEYGTRRECAEKAEEYLELVELKEYADYYPHTLSGGMKQRVALGRALAMQSEIILMDEPFSSMDEQTRQHLHEELLTVYRKLKPTIMFVTHNLDEAIHLSTRILVLKGKPAKVTGNFLNRVHGNKTANDAGYSEFRNLLFESIQ
jgi:NitT/TauT family transport system ATP-binding protein